MFAHSDLKHIGILGISLLGNFWTIGTNESCLYHLVGSFVCFVGDQRALDDAL